MRTLRHKKVAPLLVSVVDTSLKRNILLHYRVVNFSITAMSPTEVFAGTPYFAVFCLAMSSRIAWSAFPNPYVRIITELLSSKFLSLIVSKINSVFSSEGAPSVKNKITLFFFSPDSSETEPFSRLKAFSNPIRYRV